MPQICIYLLGLCEKKWDKNYSQIMSPPVPPACESGGGHVPPRSYGGAAHAVVCTFTQEAEVFGLFKRQWHITQAAYLPV